VNVFSEKMRIEGKDAIYARNSKLTTHLYPSRQGKVAAFCSSLKYFNAVVNDKAQNLTSIE
jgi:hypothetical protein